MMGFGRRILVFGFWISGFFAVGFYDWLLNASFSNLVID